MSSFKIALLQMLSVRDEQAANQAKGEEYCRRAKAMGVDLALFPEMWNIGYSECPKDEDGRRAWAAKAVSRDSGYVNHYRELAKELDMAIAVTYLEKWEGAPRNSVSLLDRHGEILFTYAKVHTCDFWFEIACTPGRDFYVSALDTAAGPVTVGAMICYDREFPESARILMLQGAEIIITPNACTLEEQRIGQYKARAFENMLGVAMTNYPAPQNNGHSVAFHGMSSDEEFKPLNSLVVEAGEGEGIYLASFDMERLRKYRQSRCWGNAFRRPSCYGLLLSDEAAVPFVREKSRR